MTAGAVDDTPTAPHRAAGLAGSVDIAREQWVAAAEGTVPTSNAVVEQQRGFGPRR